MLDPEPVLVVAAEAEMRGTLAVAIAEELRRPVAAAPDAHDAARLARARRPGAIVVDLGLEGDCGTLRDLRDDEAVAGAALIAIGPAACRDEAAAAGAAAFVPEPVDLKAVLAALVGALGQEEVVAARAA